MKIAVLNFSGNVGKSTISRYLLSPRLNNAQIIAVETINSDGTEDESLKGKQFAELTETLALLDNAIIDIGASNIETLLVRMKELRGSHEDFDYYIIPTAPPKKQQRDTISTIDELNEIGVNADKIRLIFNMVEPDEEIESVFSGLFEYHKASKKFRLFPGAVLHANELYGRLRGDKLSINDLLNLDNLKEQLSQAASKEEKMDIARLITLKRLATGVNEELDTTFKALKLT